ncbi:hypothetical protein SEUCBS140593_001671 [Sporothrix eucalyptigena]|uniref:Beta-lactamase-related domain-containing protein n=1 Tax=Sporothrix eucalyptigena TaxID=1812306 RepID=A0ABP0B082_9PEZI
MDNFESLLARATTPASGNPASADLLGAVGLVVDDQGEALYCHVAGRQSLAVDAPPLDADCTVSLGSAGKFITHIAALQLVEKGLLSLDEPVYAHVPELERCQVVTENGNGLRPPKSPITLRHLLLHASGLSDHDTVDRLYGQGTAERLTALLLGDDADILAQRISLPLIFDPGEGHAYGYSIHWTQLLVTRAAGAVTFMKYLQENIFDPLGMASTSYTPRLVEDVWQRRLHMVERKDNTLVSAENAFQGLTCSVSDVGRVLSAVLRESPKLLTERAHWDLLWQGQFATGSPSFENVRAETDNYGFVTGRANGHTLSSPPAVNWSAGGLVVEGDEALPVSGMPPGTVTWEGMPNVLWAINREKKRALFFATQLVPVGDPKANELALNFMHDAWKKFT